MIKCQNAHATFLQYFVHQKNQFFPESLFGGTRFTQEGKSSFKKSLQISVLFSTVYYSTVRGWGLDFVSFSFQIFIRRVIPGMIPSRPSCSAPPPSLSPPRYARLSGTRQSPSCSSSSFFRFPPLPPAERQRGQRRRRRSRGRHRRFRRRRIPSWEHRCERRRLPRRPRPRHRPRFPPASKGALGGPRCKLTETEL